MSMRFFSPLCVLLLLLTGCNGVQAPGAPLLAIPAVIEGASLVTMQRGVGDTVVSLVTGEDCSYVRLAKGQTYCASDPPPPAQPICTRSLGKVDCWTTPPVASPPYRNVRDGPYELTPEQERNRTSRWPKLF
ncbi:MAG: hypothetical protein LW713_08895 [Acetobacteraceae bacterium]|jgi:hypothetical protein|nr:hypothetical protein [Acetobacteraceae bacterium]